jgi:multimeric flavodoxin WrbA
MRALLERLLFQYTNFDGGKPFFKGKLKTAFVYTMNAPEGYFDDLYQKYAGMLSWYFEYIGTVASTETMQVQDYSRYHLAMFDAQQRYERRETVFPKDCQIAYELGKNMAQD